MYGVWHVSLLGWRRLGDGSCLLGDFPTIEILNLRLMSVRPNNLNYLYHSISSPSNRWQLALFHAGPILMLNVDIVKDTVEGIHLGLCAVRTIFFQKLVSLALDVLLLLLLGSRGEHVGGARGRRWHHVEGFWVGGGAVVGARCMSKGVRERWRVWSNCSRGKHAGGSGCGREIVSAQVRLQLLEEYQDQSNFVLFWQLLEWRLLPIE